MGRSDTRPFGPEIITGFVAAFPRETRFVIAFSGGADSLALLHAFARLREYDSGLRLCAVHVDHHLHPESTRWARQCMGVCGRLSVHLTVLDANPRASDAGHVDEGTARAARYAAFERILSAARCSLHGSLRRRPCRDRSAESAARSGSKRSCGHSGSTAPRRGSGRTAGARRLASGVADVCAQPPAFL